METEMKLKRGDRVYFRIAEGQRAGGQGSAKVLSLSKTGVRVQLVDADVPYRPSDDVLTLNRADISAASL